MNERIQELAEQAGFYYTDKTGFITPAGCNLQKFAELILEDVMSICEDLGDKSMDGHYCVDAIRKKFRVEL